MRERRKLADEFHAIQEEEQPGGGWRPVLDAAKQTPCGPCQEWVDGQLSATTGSIDSSCQLCSSGLDRSFVVEVVGTAHRGGLPGLIKNTSQTRICLQCFRWWQATFRDSSAAFANGSRGEEGPIGGWLGEISDDVESDNLSEHDRHILETTVTTMGSRYLGESGPDSVLYGLLFRHVDGSERALELLEGSPSLARRTLVVCRQDGIEYAMRCLRVGARDLLASPLTPNKVASALEREHRGMNIAPHDSGLMFVDSDDLVGANGDHGRLFRVRPLGESMESGYLTLRRFLRAYDLVDVDSSGHLAVHRFRRRVRKDGLIPGISSAGHLRRPAR